MACLEGRNSTIELHPQTGPEPGKRNSTLAVRRRGDWTRTSGLLLPKQVRYQLRYTP